MTDITNDAVLAVPADGAAAHRALRGITAGLLVFLIGMAGLFGVNGWAYLTFVKLKALVDRYGFGYVPAEEFPAEISEGWALILDYLPAAIYGAGFFIAMFHARRLGQAIGIRDFHYSYGWTVGSIFVPIWNLYRPWTGLGEIRNALYTARFGRFTARDGSSAFTILLGVTVFISASITRVLSRAFDDMAPPVDSAGFYSLMDHGLNVTAGLGATGFVLFGVMLAYLLTMCAQAAALVAPMRAA